jgi:hypothetical protein
MSYAGKNMKRGKRKRGNIKKERRGNEERLREN